MEKMEDAIRILDDKKSIRMSRIERHLETLGRMVSFAVKVICHRCHKGDWSDFIQLSVFFTKDDFGEEFTHIETHKTELLLPSARKKKKCNRKIQRKLTRVLKY